MPKSKTFKCGNRVIVFSESMQKDSYIVETYKFEDKTTFSNLERAQEFMLDQIQIAELAKLLPERSVPIL